MATAVRVQAQKSHSLRRAAHTPRDGRSRALKDQLPGLRHELDDLRRALYEAAQVQRRFCGPRCLRLGPYAFASEIFPVGHLSGDFISVVSRESELVFALGDIAGKGLVTGMWFLHILGTIRRYLATLGDPAAAISAVDHDLRLTGFEIPLTTLLVARLNLANGELTYCNAGHPPALLIGNSRVQELSLGGPVLGSISQATFVNGTATVRTGDTLLAYSDGIVEARNRSGVEFGAAGLLRATACASSEPSEMLFSVLASVEDFVQSRHQEDDIALVVLHRFSS